MTSAITQSNRNNIDLKASSKMISAKNSYSKNSIAKDAALKLDFLILVIETLQINAMETILLNARNIGLTDQYCNRVDLWKIRCLNPMRKTYSTGSIDCEQIDSLVKLISSMSEPLYPIIRQLLSSKESEFLNNERWNLFTLRLKSLIRERMNLRRNYISTLLKEDNNIFFRHLLIILSLSSGPGGCSRLKSSLFLNL